MGSLSSLFSACLPPCCGGSGGSSTPTQPPAPEEQMPGLTFTEIATGSGLTRDYPLDNRHKKQAPARIPITTNSRLGKFRTRHPVSRQGRGSPRIIGDDRGHQLAVFFGPVLDFSLCQIGDLSLGAFSKLGNLKRMHALASWCPDRTLVYVVDRLHLIDVETFQYRRGVS